MRFINGDPSKAFATIMRILKEFFATWRHFSFKLAVYRLLWWLGYYIPSLKVLYRWSSQGKANYVYRYIEKNFSDIIDKYCREDNLKEYKTIDDYRIWVFWAQGIENAPELVKGCYRQLLKTNGERVVLITIHNLGDYIDVPSVILSRLNNGEINLTYFSDIIRVSLLARYGGLWVDSTCYLANSIPESVHKLRLYTTLTVSCMGTNIYQNILFLFTRDVLLSYWSKNSYLIDAFLIDHIITYARGILPSVDLDYENMPMNNPKYSHLVRYLNSKWDKDLYSDLTNDTWIFKLSYKANWRAEIEGEPTFYGKLISQR